MKKFSNEKLISGVKGFISSLMKINKEDMAQYMGRFVRIYYYNPFSMKGEGHYYSGLNKLILAMLGEGEVVFATFAQIRDAGGSVKGLKGIPTLTPIIFPKKDENGNKVIGKDGKPEMVFTGRYRTTYVFPVAKATGLDADSYIDLPKKEIKERADVSTMIEAYGVPIEEDKTGAYYVPGEHRIGIPPKSFFRSEEAYYGTLFHELTHSTGEELKRDLSGISGSSTYAREELVAEFGSMLLSEEFGIKYEPSNSALYMWSWLQKIENKEETLLEAFTDATKAVKFIVSHLDKTTKEVAA